MIKKENVTAKTGIEKYNCLDKYYEARKCLNMVESRKEFSNCEQFIKNVGLCVFEGMQKEKLIKNKI
jgi:hypothetical protein